MSSRRRLIIIPAHLCIMKHSLLPVTDVPPCNLRCSNYRGSPAAPHCLLCFTAHFHYIMGELRCRLRSFITTCSYPETRTHSFISWLMKPTDMTKIASIEDATESGSIAYFVKNLGILKSLGLPLTVRDGEGEARTLSKGKSLLKCVVFTYIVVFLLQTWQVKCEYNVIV